VPKGYRRAVPLGRKAAGSPRYESIVGGIATRINGELRVLSEARMKIMTSLVTVDQEVPFTVTGTFDGGAAKTRVLTTALDTTLGNVTFDSVSANYNINLSLNVTAPAGFSGDIADVDVTQSYDLSAWGLSPLTFDNPGVTFTTGGSFPGGTVQDNQFFVSGSGATFTQTPGVGGSIVLTANGTTTPLGGTDSGTFTVSGTIDTVQQYQAKTTQQYVQDAISANPGASDFATANNGIDDIITLRQTSAGTSSQNLELRDAEYFLRGYSGGLALFNGESYTSNWFNELANQASPISTAIYSGIKLLHPNGGIAGPGQLPSTPPGGYGANLSGWISGVEGNSLSNAVNGLSSPPVPQQPSSSPDQPLPPLSSTSLGGLNVNSYDVSPSPSAISYFDPPTSSDDAFSVVGNTITGFVIPQKFGGQTFQYSTGSGFQSVAAGQFVNLNSTPSVTAIDIHSDQGLPVGFDVGLQFASGSETLVTELNDVMPLDVDTGEQAALSLTVNVNSTAPIGAAASGAVPFAIAGLDSEDTGAVSFSDGTNQVRVNVSAGQTNYTADLSTLKDGPIVSTLQVNTDAAGNAFTPVAGNGIPLDTDATYAPVLQVDGGTANIFVNAATAVPVTLAGLETGDTGTITFTDSAGHTVPLSVSASQTSYTANLSALANGTITSSLLVTDAVNNTTTATGNPVTLDQDKVAEAPILKIANISPTVPAGGSIPLGITVSSVDGDDNVLVTISGVPQGFESVTANDGHAPVVQHGANYTFTAADVNNGLTLHSTYRGGGHPVNLFTVTASNTTTGETTTSAPQIITVTDPPATTSTGQVSAWPRGLPLALTQDSGHVDRLVALLDQFMAAGLHRDQIGAGAIASTFAPRGSPEDLPFLAMPHYHAA
jgi:hypothetical protein